MKRRPKLTPSRVRVVIPDSHGNHIDPAAEAAFLKDLKALDPDVIVRLGDHLDCGGVFSAHQRSYTKEIPESYEDDCAAANSFLDKTQAVAPRCIEDLYLEGNHEAHVERWVARMFNNKRDADKLLSVYGPEKALDLKRRGIKYFYSHEMYHGLSIPGTIKLGKCFFTHGISAAKNADAVHLASFGACIQFGHTHRSMSLVQRTVERGGIGAWCPGTLAKLQPLYRHTRITDWTHGYGVDFINPSGTFLHINVPIVNGVSLLNDLTSRLHGRRAA